MKTDNKLLRIVPFIEIGFANHDEILNKIVLVLKHIDLYKY